ncbi:hypothetical protein A2635_05235 [Candidatus Peribacteria bacterium RIFCSPHIGHO2_01_FULL_51_9]|nr:MAG: hypothetical protein A2635_05235 [Candidatus Peribacteria bacterium RIFCSPHIGHO2_01_FULL_51_9]
MNTLNRGPIVARACPACHQMFTDKDNLEALEDWGLCHHDDNVLAMAIHEGFTDRMETHAAIEAMKNKLSMDEIAWDAYKETHAFPF